MKKLTREQLYKWVWSCPVTRIAEELRVSGSGLGRKCKAYNIPTPGRGHWHQVVQGKQVRCLPLPDPDKGFDQVSIKVSQERAAELDLLPMPLVGSLTAPAAFEDSILEIATPTMLESIEDSKASATGGSASCISSPQISVAVSTADPADIMTLAVLYGQHESATRFIEALKAAGRECEPSTKAVLILWTGAARAFLSQSDPIAQVINECHRVASGEGNPEWWASLQRE